jgi:hypothetical protein
MSQRFIRRTSGWIPISVLLLLALALLSRHAPELPDGATTIAAPAAEAEHFIHATHPPPR